MTCGSVVAYLSFLWILSRRKFKGAHPYGDGTLDEQVAEKKRKRGRKGDRKKGLVWKKRSGTKPEN